MNKPPQSPFEDLKAALAILEKLTQSYKILMDIKEGSGMGKEFEGISQSKIISENLKLQNECYAVIQRSLKAISQAQK